MSVSHDQLLHLHLAHPKYRADIDGLRAIAVLSVVAFHAFPDWVKGGFIGVDIFFVISGYLISTIIFENLEKGSFSFLEFYARRIRRIFPALILVLIASYSFAWFALLSQEYKQLGKHIAGGAVFISNFVLSSEAGYFDNIAESKPLLHLWSLGVEEQFYIIWPFLLWLAWKIKNKTGLLTITVIIASASFFLNISGMKGDPVATFFSPQTRFWELLCGGLLAWVGLYQKHLNIYGKKFFNMLSLLGFVLLGYGFTHIDKGIDFPGWRAVVPVGGAVLIIYSDASAWLNRMLLTNKLAVGFGLISYPLYLWHWPLLSFARILEQGQLSVEIRSSAIAISIFLAWLTYMLIERPMRNGKYGKATVFILLLLIAGIGYIGLMTFLKDGLPERFSRSEARTNHARDQLQLSSKTIHINFS